VGLGRSGIDRWRKECTTRNCTTQSCAASVRGALSAKKDFDRWNKHKKKIHGDAERPFYHAREIWWCAVGLNIGNELDGTGKEHDRPVLVIRPFNAETFFGVALIGHPRSGRFYFPLGKVEGREAVANLSQVRLFDTKRLIRKIGMLEERTFRELAKTLALTLFPFLPLK
jgi:mRNA-degrading endonuclease toxin of MazEF toxin-antitoxin module